MPKLELGLGQVATAPVQHDFQEQEPTAERSKRAALHFAAAGAARSIGSGKLFACEWPDAP